MKPVWHTRWQAMDLVVERDGDEIDRVSAADIELAIVVYAERGATPGDLSFVVLRTRTHDLLGNPRARVRGCTRRTLTPDERGG